MVVEVRLLTPVRGGRRLFHRHRWQRVVTRVGVNDTLYRNHICWGCMAEKVMQ